MIELFVIWACFLFFGIQFCRAAAQGDKGVSNHVSDKPIPRDDHARDD